jgi:hypothetical protein
MSAADAAAATQGSLSVPAASSAEQCDYAVWRQAPRGLFVMFEGGTLARVDVRESGRSVSVASRRSSTSKAVRDGSVRLYLTNVGADGAIEVFIVARLGVVSSALHHAVERSDGGGNPQAVRQSCDCGPASHSVTFVLLADVETRRRSTQ